MLSGSKSNKNTVYATIMIERLENVSEAPVFVSPYSHYEKTIFSHLSCVWFDEPRKN